MALMMTPGLNSSWVHGLGFVSPCVSWLPMVERAGQRCQMAASLEQEVWRRVGLLLKCTPLRIHTGAVCGATLRMVKKPLAMRVPAGLN
jgi:hypothetical protein